ncbi:MAG: hypothetical protein IKG56_04045 [Clostridia bacterium]|nr:hypothetical protein [Clostridia bacterium]
MIVFYFCITIIFIVITILVSSVSLEIKRFEIKNADMLKKILNTIEEKEFYNIFDYIVFEINIRLKLFKFIPVKILKLDNNKIKIEIMKYMKKDRNEKLIKVKRKRYQKLLLKFKKKIEQNIQIKNVNLKLLIGLTKADITAIVTGILNSIIAILVLKYIDNYQKKNIEKKYNKIINSNRKRINYRIIPVYSEEFAFNLNLNVKIDLSIISII